MDNESTRQAALYTSVLRQFDNKCDSLASVIESCRNEFNRVPPCVVEYHSYALDRAEAELDNEIKRLRLPESL
jgi:hypothetical protein